MCYLFYASYVWVSVLVHWFMAHTAFLNVGCGPKYSGITTWGSSLSNLYTVLKLLASCHYITRPLGKGLHPMFYFIPPGMCSSNALKVGAWCSWLFSWSVKKCFIRDCWCPCLIDVHFLCIYFRSHLNNMFDFVVRKTSCWLTKILSFSTNLCIFLTEPEPCL